MQLKLRCAQLLLSLAAMSTSSGCAAVKSGPAPASQVSQDTSSAAPASQNLWQLPDAPRIIAIGDLHGDLAATRKALKLGGAIDANDRWIGGDLVVVQTGDQIDRGNQDREILDLFERLKVEAKAAGGKFLVLIGNHEVMNSMLDFRYVTNTSLRAFSEFTSQLPTTDHLPTLKPKERGRAAAFRPTGPYAKIVATNFVVLKVGDTVFVHGGLLPSHVTYGIDRINSEVSMWLGNGGTVPSHVSDDDSPLWLRIYSTDTGANDCKILEDTLELLAANRMIIGHTPQAGGINSRCQKKVWRIDSGISKYYGGNVEILEIKDGKVQVLR